MDSDSIMQGTVITLFAVFVVSSIVGCTKVYLKKKTSLKQSASTEDLTSVGTEDPES